MDVNFSFVEWQEAESRSSRGTLETDILDALDDSEATWIEDLEHGDVLSVVFSLGAACDAVFPNCSASNRSAIERSFARYMTEEGTQWNELPGKLDPEYYWLALSPATVAEIHAAQREIDFGDVKRQYKISCPPNVRDDLAYSPDDFIHHLQSWGNVFAEADDLKKGLIVSVS